jgi:MBG domain (YGX type)/Putative Ig domain
MLIVFCTLLLAGRSTRGQGNGNGSGPGLQQELVLSPATIPDGQYGANYKAQTIKASGGKSPYTYSISAGNLPPGMSFSSGGVLSGNPVTTGRYAFTVTAEDNGKGKNAVTGSQNYSLNISQASLMITAGSAAMNQGAAMPRLTVSYNGFVNGDNASSLSRLPGVTTTATATSPPGVYPITVSGAVDPNYNISYTPGTLTIDAVSNPSPPGVSMVVTAQPQTKEYGAADPALTYTVSGLPSGTGTNIFTGSLSRAPGENVGSYAISRGSLSAGSGYSFSFDGNFLTITKASQYVSWTQDLLVGCDTAMQIQLAATASSGLSVTYSVSDASVATVSGNVLTLLHPGTAVVTATQAGDANHAAAALVTDTVVYQPASLINQHWSDAIFFDNSSGEFVGWQWYKNGDSIPGAILPYYSESPSLDGKYFVIATNKAGKQIQSCMLTITGDSTIPGSIRVYPNPSKVGTQVTVTGNYSSSALQGAILQVVDVNGRVRQQITAVQPSIQVTMPAQTGIYIINLLLADGQKVSTNVLVD